jgi:protein O-mannosyl-transferase
VYSLRFSLKTQKFLIALALTALVWIVFAQTAHFDWVRYDERDYVYGSARVTSGLSFSNIAWAFTHFHAANWHPITTLSHMLDCQLFGVNPGLHHFSSVVIHTLAVIALFFALDSLTGKSGEAELSPASSPFIRCERNRWHGSPSARTFSAA